MARRKNAVEAALLGVALTIGAAIAAVRYVGDWVRTDPRTAVPVIVIIVAAAVSPFVVRRYLVTRRYSSLAAKVNAEVRAHSRALVRKRAQTYRLDDYGNLIPKDWDKEVAYFIQHQVVPRLSKAEYRVLNARIQDIAEMIEALIADDGRTNPPEQEFSPGMSPSEYEQYCARLLRRSGWNATVTKLTGDQGADVVAEKDGVRIVLQCKLYTQPVGNKAVQEVFAAKTFERADHAAVVSNRKYTPAAERLASANGVLLLHHKDLDNLDNVIMGGGAGPSAQSA